LAQRQSYLGDNFSTALSAAADPEEAAAHTPDHQ
jgi:hypothetical protein